MGTLTRDGKTWQAYAENLQRSRTKVRQTLGARDKEPTVKAAARVMGLLGKATDVVVELADLLEVPNEASLDAIVHRVRGLKNQTPASELARAAQTHLRMHLLLDACAEEFNKPRSYDSQPFVIRVVEILTGPVGQKKTCTA